MKIDFFSAACTPLDHQERLDQDGLEVHLNQQWDYGATGVLIGGTMGLMQLLTNSTYLELVAHGARCSKGKGQVLIGVGDTSYSRTNERIQAVSHLPIDGVVVVTPWFYPFSEEELFDYYCALARESKHPLYIYYLPKRTRVELQVETILRLASQPNIRGIKSSADTDWTMQLFERAPASFQVIVSAPLESARLARIGVRNHLDGIYAVFPRLAARLLAALRREDWHEAERCEELFKGVLGLFQSKFPLFGATSAILNSQGVSGKCNVSPLAALSADAVQELLAIPEIQLAIVGELPRSASGSLLAGNDNVRG